MTLLIIAPSWLIAASKVGKERRAAQEAAKAAAAAEQGGEKGYTAGYFQSSVRNVCAGRPSLLNKFAHGKAFAHA